MRVRVGEGLAPSVGRMVARIVAELGPGGDPAAGTLAIGADDPMLPGADARRPLAVVPVAGPRPTPWGRALVATADAVILLDPSEAHRLAGALDGRQVLVAGLARPDHAVLAGGLDAGGAPAELRRAAHDEGLAARQSAGVAWISGRGLGPVADALEAWSAGRAVVVLPGTDMHEVLRGGHVLRPRTGAEVLEATRFLFDNPPLARALAARGRDTAAGFPSPRRVALGLLEGMELARQSVVAR